MRYASRYVHKISPKATDLGPDVELTVEALGDPGALGRALRDAGILSKGERVRESRVEPDGKVVVFPPLGSIWWSIVLTPATVTTTVRATDGAAIQITAPHPDTLPSNARAEVLHALYRQHVKPLGADGHWKGPCEAVVPAMIADDVQDAMDFMGSLIDERTTLPDGNIRLYSTGYWAHGF